VARPKPLPDPTRYTPCQRCNQAYQTVAWWQGQPICNYCYLAGKRTTGRCIRCRHVGICPGLTPTGELLCRKCSGIRLNVDCVQCGEEAELYRAGHCWRCELATQVDQLLSDPATGTINAQLAPMAFALKSMTRPNSGVTWLRNQRVRSILLQLAQSPTIDQSLLNGLPPSRPTTHIRALLAEHGIADAKVDYRDRFDTWSSDKLTEVDDPASQLVVRSYLRWHLAHKLDGGCSEGRFLASKQAVTVAVDFLNWLAGQSVPFTEVSQSDVDCYIAEGPETRRLLTRFLPWAIKSYRLPKLDITPHRRDTTREKTADEQIEQLKRLFAHPDMTAEDRLMAALILVFGQPAHKVVALQWKDITIHHGAQAITLGKHPVILEHPLDGLVIAVSKSVANRQTAANAVTSWVFPGYLAGSHLTANHVRIRLKKLGFPPRSTRIGTWQSITQTTPPPVLADALGLNPQTAIRHARRGSGQYGAYIADRIHTDTSNPQQ
jgi:integrase